MKRAEADNRMEIRKRDMGQIDAVAEGDMGQKDGTAKGEELFFRSRMDGAGISDALDLLDEDLLHAALAARGKRKGRAFRLRRWLTAAACLGGICIAAALSLIGLRKTEPEQMEGAPWMEVALGEELAPPVPDITGTASDPDGEKESGEGKKEVDPVPIHTLLVAEGTYAAYEMQVQMIKIPAGEYEGMYEKVCGASESMLAKSMGDPVPGAEGCFLVAGHEDLQYLVKKEQEEYSLWKFQCFVAEEYPYRDVLELVYRLDGAEDIAKIQVAPAKMDNTDEGKRIQEEIGTHMITDPESIKTIYEVLASMTCYGASGWDKIDYGAEDAPSDGAGGSHRAVRLGRYLTITTAYGNEIDGLKYTAVSDMFYEFSGIAYSPLEAEQAEAVRRALGIDLPQ